MITEGVCPKMSENVAPPPMVWSSCPTRVPLILGLLGLNQENKCNFRSKHIRP